ncbi:MAG: hypothetical protein JWL95_2138 [Gemmatimonadetes bacterium]|nr:hypothetical protein [Gemmatimonadota bacterium]
MRRAIATLLACALTACGSTTSTGTQNPPPTVSTRANISGSYTLKSVDGKALPATVADSTFVSGLLTLADSTWRQTLVVRYAQGGSGAAGDTLIESGIWNTDAGSKLTLFDLGSSELYVGTYGASGFTVSSKTSTLVYAK